MKCIVRLHLSWIVGAVLCLSVAMAIPPFARAEENEAKLLYLVKNEDALLELRKSALDQLLQAPTPDVYETIFSVFKKKPKTDSAKLFRVYLDRQVVAAKNQTFVNTMRATLKDPHASEVLRESILRLLFQADSEEAKALAVQILRNHREPESLRLAALIDLAHHETLEMVQDMAEALAQDKKETFKIRLTALNFLESRGDPKGKEKIFDMYQSIVTNPAEPSRLQIHLIARGVAAGIPDFQKTLFTVMRNVKSDPATRAAALHGLMLHEDLAMLLLEDLRRRYRSEQEPFKQDVKAAIESLSESVKQRSSD